MSFAVVKLPDASTILVCCILSTGCTRTPSPAVETRKPKLEIETDQDAGVYLPWNATVIEKRVWVSNSGADTLVVRILSKSCGCAEFAQSEYRIAAGQKEAIRTQVRPGIAVGESSVGVRLGTNDPLRPVVDVRIRWNVRSPVRYSTNQVSLRREKQAYVGSFIVSRNGDSDLDLTLARLRTWPEEMRAAIKVGSSKLDVLGEIIVELPTDYSGSETTGWVQLDFGKSDWSEKVDVALPDRKGIRLEPGFLVFRETSTGLPVSQKVVLHSLVPFQILDAVTSSKCLEVHFPVDKRKTADGELNVTLTLPPSIRNFQGHIQLRVQTDVPQTVRLPVLAFARGGGAS